MIGRMSRRHLALTSRSSSHSRKYLFFAQWIPQMLYETGWKEPLADRKVTYHIEIDGRLVLIENVPARVNVETGERYFLPETVERLQQAVWGRCRPVRTIETPVYEYGALA